MAAVLTAAGHGTRLKSAEPKALVLLTGVPFVVHAYLRLAEVADTIVVTCPPGSEETFQSLLPDALVISGGVTRQDSVRRGLSVLPQHRDPASTVIVHDAARPLASSALFANIARTVAAGGASVVPGLPLVDTIVKVGPWLPPEPHGVAAATRSPEGEAHVVVANPHRGEFRAVQTPQGFPLGLLAEVHEQARAAATDESAAASDDASLVRQYAGVDTVVIPGEEQAMKLTTQMDVVLAEAMMKAGYWT